MQLKPVDLRLIPNRGEPLSYVSYRMNELCSISFWSTVPVPSNHLCSMSRSPSRSPIGDRRERRASDVSMTERDRPDGEAQPAKWVDMILSSFLSEIAVG